MYKAPPTSGGGLIHNSRDDAFQKALWPSHGFTSSAGICSWQPAAGNASPLPRQQTMQQPRLACRRKGAGPSPKVRRAKGGPIPLALDQKEEKRFLGSAWPMLTS